MTEIKWDLTEKDIHWEMDWTDFNKKFPEKRKEIDKEIIFEESIALGHLLINEVIFINDHWWEDEWPEKAKKSISLNVNCNDVFMWGCADAEELPYSELENLYNMWKKDPVWGSVVWCMIRRELMPQKPVEDIIKKMGIWDLKALKLKKNNSY